MDSVTCRYGLRPIGRVRYSLIFVFCATAFLSTILNVGLLQGHQGQFPGQQAPEQEKLFTSWLQYSNSLRQLSPFHSEFTVSGMPHFSTLWDSQWRKTVCFVANKDNMVYQYQYGPKVQSEKQPKDSVSIYSGKNAQFQLFRANSDSQWYLSVAAHTSYPPSAGLSVLFAIPGFNENEILTSQLDRFIATRDVSRSSSTTEVYHVKLQNSESGLALPDYATRKAIEFQVYFEKEIDWLPAKVIVHYENGLMLEFVYGDHRKVEDLLVPFSVTLTEVGAIDGSINRVNTANVQYEVIERVSEQQVKDRCRLSYYGLPDINVETDGNRKYWPYLAILFGLLLIVSTVVLKRNL